MTRGFAGSKEKLSGRPSKPSICSVARSCIVLMLRYATIRVPRDVASHTFSQRLFMKLKALIVIVISSLAASTTTTLEAAAPEAAPAFAWAISGGGKLSDKIRGTDHLQRFVARLEELHVGKSVPLYDKAATAQKAIVDVDVRLPRRSSLVFSLRCAPRKGQA